MRSLTRDEVRSIDRFAIETMNVPGVILMENAGRNAADLIQQAVQGFEKTRVAVVAGPGNNGGDGFVIARHAAMRGATVTVFLVVPADKLTGDAKINFDILKNAGFDLRELTEEEIPTLAETLQGYDTVVDALGGTGITGALHGPVAKAVNAINALGRGAGVVSVDIPTGLDCDTGRVDGPAVRATLTITFFARKVGFDSVHAMDYTGSVKVADIGIDAEYIARQLGLED